MEPTCFKSGLVVVVMDPWIIFTYKRSGVESGRISLRKPNPGLLDTKSWERFTKTMWDFNTLLKLWFCDFKLLITKPNTLIERWEVNWTYYEDDRRDRVTRRRRPIEVCKNTRQDRTSQGWSLVSEPVGKRTLLSNLSSLDPLILVKSTNLYPSIDNPGSTS